MEIYLSLLVAIVGLIMYILSANPKIQALAFVGVGSRALGVSHASRAHGGLAR